MSIALPEVNLENFCEHTGPGGWENEGVLDK